MKHAACELHGSSNHAPEPLTVEQHHLIPQAWQHFAQQGAKDALPEERARWARGAATAGVVVLFDPRTVGVAPTCHRNVHYCIVALMRALNAEPASSRDTLHPEFVRAIRRKLSVRGGMHGAEFECAQLALVRYAAAGHKLSELQAAGLYGEA